jgi:hypothetical protein
MKSLIQILLLTILVFAIRNVFGQKTNNSEPVDFEKTYKIEHNDGSIIIGKILQKDSVNLVITTSSMTKIEIPISKIKTIEIDDELNLKNGNYWFPNPHATRYLHAPSAFNIKKGEGEYHASLAVIIPLASIDIGITDNISIGGGGGLVGRDPIFFINPKVGFKISEKFHAGGSVLFARMAGPALGSIFGTVTYGTIDHNITTSLGWGYIEGEFSQKPIIVLSGLTRVSKRVALVTDNCFIPIDGYYSLFSYGFRFFKELKTFKFSFINNRDIAGFIWIGAPCIGFTTKF